MKVTEHSWNSEPEVGNLIAALIDIHQCQQVLEIGVFKGATALSMMKANYTGIDIEDFREEIVKDQMAAQNHKFIIGDSLTELKKLPWRHYDLIFLDTVHEFKHCMAEFKLCENLIKAGGLICFHDAVMWVGVKEVLSYIKSFSHFDVLVLNTPHGEGLGIVRCNY